MHEGTYLEISGWIEMHSSEHMTQVLILGVAFAETTPRINDKATPFASVAEAIKAEHVGARGDLNEEALQYILNSCELDWRTNWTKFSPNPEVRAYTCPNRRFCVACRGYYGEFGSGREVECCLIDSSSALRWRRWVGATWEKPRVSALGHVAFLMVGSSYDVKLSVYDSEGTNVVAENLGVWLGRPILGFEVYGFSPDASLFFTTMRCRRTRPRPERTTDPRVQQYVLACFRSQQERRA